MRLKTTKKTVKHKYVTTKLFVEDDRCISESVNIICENNNHIRIHHFIVCNHYKICPTKKGININGRIKSNREDRQYDDDKTKEDKIREEMNKNKDISAKGLHEMTGFNTSIISRYYMKIRRENYGRILL